MLVLATRNKRKVEELSPILQGIPWRAVDEKFFAEEGVESLMANALIKARKAREFCEPQDVTMGEDTGLFVEALGGEPGVCSSRYAGEGATFKDNIKKLLESLERFANARRSAFFITVCACLFPEGRIVFSCGLLDGKIALEPSGGHGFGYDPVFFVPGINKTLAEISFEEKTKMSHRYKAMVALLPYTKEAL